MCFIKSYKANRFSIRNIVLYISSSFALPSSQLKTKKEEICFPHKQAKEKKGPFFPTHYFTRVQCTSRTYSLSVPCAVPDGTMHGEDGHLPRLKAISENC